MSRPQEEATESERSSARDAETDADTAERETPPIDEDVVGSVNAALPEADD